MPQEKIKVLIAAGGTGGHLLPAKQLAELLLQKPECSSIFFAGYGLKDRRTFESLKYQHQEIKSSSINKKNFWKAPFLIGRGLFQSLKLIKVRKPNVVVGFGSFHTFPVLLAAYILRVPLILFEPNRVCGKVNRLFAKKAKAFTFQFPPADFLSYKIVPRLPWNIKNNFLEISSIEAKKKLGLDPNKFTFLIFGGSQGSNFINRLVLKTLKKLKKSTDFEFQVIHVTGEEKTAFQAKAFYLENNIRCYVKSYEKEMFLLFKASDLAICRSGASTIAELITFEKPAILIPFPRSSEKHQQKNAEFLSDFIGSAITLLEDKTDSEILLSTIEYLFKKEREKFTVMKAEICKYKREEEKPIFDLATLTCEIGRQK